MRILTGPSWPRSHSVQPVPRRGWPATKAASSQDHHWCEYTNHPHHPWVHTWLTLTWWRRWSWRSWAPRCPPGWRTGRWRWTPLDLLSLLPLSWRGKRAGLVGFPLLFSLFPHQNFLALSIWHLSAFHMLKGTRNNHCCCYADNYHYHSLSIIVQKLW